MLHEVNNAGRADPLVIIPGNKLDTIWVEHDTRTGIKYGRTVVTLKVSGYKGLITVSKESLHGFLILTLYDSTYIFVGGIFAKISGKFENRYINSGDTEIHACEIDLHRSYDLSHSL